MSKDGGRYFDPLPPPPGSPRLLGDKLDSLTRFRRTVELRSGSPTPSLSPLELRNLMIAHAVTIGFSQQAVGKAMGISQQGVSCIIQLTKATFAPEVMED